VYDLDTIINAANQETIKPVHVTTNRFECSFESDFLVLSNGKRILGPDFLHRNSFTLETIGEPSPPRRVNFVGENQKCVFQHIIKTFWFDEKTNSFFIGKSGGHLKQYTRGSCSYSWKLVKDYGDVGIQVPVSSCGFENLAVFGGSFNKVAVVDTHKRKLVRVLETAVGMISSLEICKVSECRVYLVVIGSELDYSKGQKDLIDIADLVKKDL
jgi:hypothetical protein